MLFQLSCIRICCRYAMKKEKTLITVSYLNYLRILLKKLKKKKKYHIHTNINVKMI